MPPEPPVRELNSVARILKMCAYARIASAKYGPDRRRAGSIAMEATDAHSPAAGMASRTGQPAFIVSSAEP